MKKELKVLKVLKEQYEFIEKALIKNKMDNQYLNCLENIYNLAKSYYEYKEKYAKPDKYWRSVEEDKLKKLRLKYYKEMGDEREIYNDINDRIDYIEWLEHKLLVINQEIKKPITLWEYKNIIRDK